MDTPCSRRVTTASVPAVMEKSVLEKPLTTIRKVHDEFLGLSLQPSLMISWSRPLQLGGACQNSEVARVKTTMRVSDHFLEIHFGSEAFLPSVTYKSGSP